MGTGQDVRNHFAISSKGIAFVARKVHATIPDNTFTYPYFVPIIDYEQAPMHDPLPISIHGTDTKGSASHIRIASDEVTLAFLFANAQHPHAKKLFLSTIENLEARNVFAEMGGYFDSDDYEPPISFELSSTTFRELPSIFMTYNLRGRVVLSHLVLERGRHPSVIFRQGSVSSFLGFKKGQTEHLLLSSSSFIDSALWHILDVGLPDNLQHIYSATNYGKEYGLSSDMVTEFWFWGSTKRRVHSFMIYPSNFNKMDKYPWILIPHGGPVAATSDMWSTRVCF